MSNSYMGDVRAMSFKFVPRGWAACDGRLIPIAQNQALFMLLRTAYGGDGRANFALPALPGVPAQNGATLDYCICVAGPYPSE